MHSVILHIQVHRYFAEHYTIIHCDEQIHRELCYSPSCEEVSTKKTNIANGGLPSKAHKNTYRQTVYISGSIEC